jgi:tRNA threonylcarbamoyladenosine biosynthesis protein TsaB
LELKGRTSTGLTRSITLPFDVLVLALDTSSAGGSAALVRDREVVLERAGDASRTQGERLPRELMTLLEAAQTTLDAVDRFAVCIGPGSFTGLRVGIATIQGLALSLDRRVVPVSAFEALAVNSQRPTPRSQLPTAIWIDAHRGEVFAALYDSMGREIAEPTSLKPEATLDAWSTLLRDVDRIRDVEWIRFAGDGAIRYRDTIANRLGRAAAVEDAVPLLAASIGTIAAAHEERAVRPHALVPLYVRRSDAELARDRREAAGEPRRT